MDDQRRRLTNLLRHIEHVRDDCLKLGTILLEQDEQMGLLLIANGQIHDHSKFAGIEWEYLNDVAFPFQVQSPEHERNFLAAVRQHVLTNPHHPEYWDGIANMPQVYLAELCADWHARSSEQGTCLMDWVRGRAAERFKYSLKSRVYRDIRRFTSLLLDREF